MVFSIVLVPLLPLFVILFLLCTSRNNEKDIIINEFKLFFESKFNIIANNYLIQNNERYLIECKKIKEENIKLIDKRINDFYLDQIAIDKICDFENISKKIEEISKEINKEIEIELDREEKLSSFLLNHTGLSILEVEIKKIYNVLTLSVNNHTCIGKKIMIICSKYAEPKINDVISVKGYKLPFTNEYVPNSIITGTVTNIFKMNMDNLKRVTDANITDTIQIINLTTFFKFIISPSKIAFDFCFQATPNIRYMKISFGIAH